LVPVENQGSYTHPTVAEVASPFLSSLSDAKSKLQPTFKIARKCTAFLRLQPLNPPTRFREDPIKLIRLGHAHRDTRAGKLGSVHLADGGILVLIFDHVAALPGAGLAQAMGAAAADERLPARAPLAATPLAASLCDALQPGSNVDAVAIDAGLVVDYVTDIDADAELHAALRLDCGIALCHLGLDGGRAPQQERRFKSQENEREALK
jgi:hypothetical protein